MENNENKEVINLTDEELKKVTGGLFDTPGKKIDIMCRSFKNPSECPEEKHYKWVNGVCIGCPIKCVLLLIVI